MELRVPQVRRLPVRIYRANTTHKCLSLCEALGPPRPLIFARAFALRTRTPLLPAALAFVSFGFVLVRVRRGVNKLNFAVISFVARALAPG
jgi:hypothetical protein